MKFFRFLIILVGLIVADQVKVRRNAAKYRMPAEWEPHVRTFMVWPQYGQIWIKNIHNETQNDVARIANSIVKFEPVVMFASRHQLATARKKLHPNIKVVAMEVDDLWARDTFPIFLFKTRFGRKRISGVDMNYNGYGKKRIYKKDAKLAVKVLRMYGLERITSTIVAEGGALETDGRGTLFATKSSIVNSNRNNKTIDEIEVELKKLLGMKKVIWFDGVKGEDITDEHVDVLVRFVRPGVVVVTRPFPGSPPDVWSACSDQALRVLKKSTDAEGNRFKIIEISEPNLKRISFKGNTTKFCNSYANFYIGNKFVAVAEFGDRKSDLKAQKILQAQFPTRKIVPIQINAIANGGGGIHCAVHHLPALRRDIERFWYWFYS